jgi:ubiquinone/menaquinone biosynthesis C-methylase UbiE
LRQEPYGVQLKESHLGLGMARSEESEDDKGVGDARQESRQGLRIPQYYRNSYQRLYAWFSRFYDLFVRTAFFFVNGGPGGERRWRTHVIDLLDPNPGDKIADLCSGTGTLTIMIGERMQDSGEVIGIEISPDQMKTAAKKPRPGIVTFIRGDASRTGYPDGYFDGAAISGALHELPGPVRSGVLSEAFRIIRPLGRLVVTDHNRPRAEWKARLMDFLERFNPEHHTYRELLASGLEHEILQAGFRVIKTEVMAWDLCRTVVAERPAKTNIQQPDG